MSGLFVVLEGGDSVGKSTQVNWLAAALEASGVDHLLTKQPGGTALGSGIRSLLLDPASRVDPRAESLLYAADKAQHVAEVIRPALAEGRVVVCDRYLDSMLAYQGAGRVLAMAEVERIARWATGGLQADLTILLDADPALAVDTIADKDRLEQAGIDFHTRVREHFLALAAADPRGHVVIPALTSRSGVAAQIRAELARFGLELSDPAVRMGLQGSGEQAAGATRGSTVEGEPAHQQDVIADD